MDRNRRELAGHSLREDRGDLNSAALCESFAIFAVMVLAHIRFNRKGREGVAKGRKEEKTYEKISNPRYRRCLICHSAHTGSGETTVTSIQDGRVSHGIAETRS